MRFEKKKEGETSDSSLLLKPSDHMQSPINGSVTADEYCCVVCLPRPLRVLLPRGTCVAIMTKSKQSSYGRWTCLSIPINTYQLCSSTFIAWWNPLVSCLLILRTLPTAEGRTPRCLIHILQNARRVQPARALLLLSVLYTFNQISRSPPM